MSLHLIDCEHLSEIAGLLGKDDFLGIVDTFSEHSHALLHKLNESPSPGSEDIVILLHSLKGCCKNMGATALASRFSDIESLARRNELHDLARLLPELHAELDQTILSLQSFIDQC